MQKFAVLPYVNAAPLVHFLPELYPGAELIYRPPRETLSELTARRVDAAIVPVVDYFDTSELDMVSGLGICADGEVESVLLQCRRPLREVRTVNLDPASKTSNLLVELLLKKHFRVRQEIRFGTGRSQADASVVIGDRALRAEPALESYDLAWEWRNMTGLPFVFAVWAHWTDHPERDRLSRILHIAKRAGLDAIAELSRLHAKRLGLTESRCHRYLTSCIQYDLGPAEEKGMQLFWELYRDVSKEHEQTVKEEPVQIRRIVRDDRKSRATRPIFARIS